MKTLISLLFSVVPLVAFSQNDKHISEDKVPLIIRSYIKSQYPAFKKIKYYTETVNDTMQFLAELERKEENISLQFYEDGKLYEIEKEVAFEDLPSETRKKITEELKSRFLKYKIKKVQFVNPHLVTEYELNIRGTNTKGSGYFELYFDKDGKFLKSEETMLQSIPSQF